MEKPLSHFDARSGRAKMVDVGGKPVTHRKATARGSVRISAELVTVLRSGTLEKGDAFTVAKTAGILAAKDTGHLIPMCHPLPLNVVEVALELDEPAGRVHIEATARPDARTGGEKAAPIAAPAHRFEPAVAAIPPPNQFLIRGRRCFPVLTGPGFGAMRPSPRHFGKVCARGNLPLKSEP